MPNDFNGAEGISERTEDNLLALVGYAEIEKASKVSRSTIERACRGPWDDGEPQLRKPGKIGSRSVWTASDVNDWLLARARWQTDVVSTLARVSADDLGPEQLEDQALSLSAQALSKRTGKAVDASSISLHVTRVIDGGDLEWLERDELRLRAEKLAELPVDEAIALSAAILPQLRPVLRTSARGNDLDDQAVVPAAAADLVSFLIQADLLARLSLGREAPDNFGALAKRLAGYGVGRATILSAWLFPSLRSIMVANTNGADAQLFTDEAMLKELAWAALDDERWSAAEQQLIARQRSQVSGGLGSR